MTNNGTISTFNPTTEGAKIFHLVDEFNNDTLKSFISFSKNINSDDQDAIIYINSPGGDVNVLNSIIGIMESIDITWHTVAIGDVMSAGLLLLATGDKRYATKRAWFMFHDLFDIVWGHPDQIVVSAKRLKLLSRRLIKLFASRTLNNSKWWYDKANSYPDKCFFFYADEAKKLGVIDYIGVPRTELLPTVTIYKTTK